MTTGRYQHGQGDPMEAASRAHFSNKKQQIELKMLFEFVSIAPFSKQMLEHAVWIGLNCKCSKHMVEGNEKDQCHISHYLTRPWPRPGKFPGTCS